MYCVPTKWLHKFKERQEKGTITGENTISKVNNTKPGEQNLPSLQMIEASTLSVPLYQFNFTLTVEPF
jgi:hypothetical protein